MKSNRPSRLSYLALTLAVLALAVPAQSAPTPDESCRAAKLKAAGKYAGGLLKCYAKAATDGAMPDGECLTKAAGKLGDAFDTADGKADSGCIGLDSTSSTVVQALPPAVEAAAPPEVGGGKCPSAVHKAAGKLASSELGAWSKFVTGGDSARRDEAITKARGKFASSMSKAESQEGCLGTGQAAAVQLAVEDGIEPLLECLTGSGSCAEEEAEAGETVTTDGDGSGPDAEEPLAASVETPNAGTVILHVVDSATTPPPGYSVLGQEIEVTAPPASVSSPLILTFTIDASLLPVDPLTVTLTRNGVLVADCSGAPGVASPDPCVQSRTVLAGGDLEIVALSSQASIWSPIVPNGAPTTTSTTTTSTTLPQGDYWMRWQVRADKVGSDVATEIDIGWAGGTHDIDPVDGSLMRFILDCPSAALPSYGACTVTGFDPAEGNCRCSNNSATVCNEPYAADVDDCGGSTCICYTRPPLPAVTSGTPVCMFGTASSNASGTWNPDNGSGNVSLDERIKLHTGNTIEQPCPVCVGDATANDGVRGGLCDIGATPAAACDSNGSDPTYPAPGGGSTSLDCLPSPSTNIGGVGMRFPHVQTTSSVSLPSSLPCVNTPSESCHCAACSSDATLGCSSDAECATQLGRSCALDIFESCYTNADCAAVNEGNCHQTFNFCQGASAIPCTVNADCTSVNVGPCVEPTCTVKGVNGASPLPDSCSGTCDVGVDGEAACSGPGVSNYCDGLVEEDGKGVVSCTVNADCDFYAAGDCTIAEAQECFAPTITAAGVADSDSPRTVAVLCVGGIQNSSANGASGLPGPARLRTDWNVTYGQQ